MDGLAVKAQTLGGRSPLSPSPGGGGAARLRCKCKVQVPFSDQQAAGRIFLAQWIEAGSGACTKRSVRFCGVEDYIVGILTLFIATWTWVGIGS